VGVRSLFDEGDLLSSKQSKTAHAEPRTRVGGVLKKENRHNSH
jgi:hypothetical protein